MVGLAELNLPTNSGHSLEMLSENIFIAPKQLVPGAGSLLAATKKPGGTLEANRLNVGRDGVVPQ